MKLALVASLVLLPALAWLRFDTRPATALPADTPEAKRFAELAAFLGERESVVFMLCGEQTARAEAVFVEAAGAWTLGELVAGATRADGDDLVDQALALWPEGEFAALQTIFAQVDERVATLRSLGQMLGGSVLLARAQADPLDLGREIFGRMRAAGAGLSIDATQRLRAGGCMVAFVLPRLPSTDRAFVRTLAAAIADAREKVSSAGGTLFATGPHLYAAEYDQRLSYGLWLSGLLSVLAVVAICFLLFRDVIAMLLIGVALAVASGWTLGAATLLLGPLQILAVSAASILPAVGIDAGIQFYVHRRMVRAIYVAALASGLGFLTLVFAETRAFRQFGVLLALGVAANTLAMATLLPALFRLAERLGWKARPVGSGAVEWIGGALGRLPKWAAAGVLLAALLPLIVLYRPPPQQLGFSALIDPTLQASKAQRVFERVFGASDRHVFIASEAPTEDDAIEAQKRLLIQVDGVSVEGGPLLWATQRDLARAREWRARLDPPAVAARLRAALEKADFVVAPFEPGLARLAALGTLPVRAPALARLAHRQRVGAVAGGYWALTSLFVAPTADGAAVMQQLRASLPEGSHLVGPFALDLELRERLLADGRLLALLAVGAVVFALLAARMRARQLLAVVSALALVFVFLWLSLGALGLPLTLVTLLVVPFVLGIGIDASVYLAEHDAFHHDRRALLAEHLRPLLGSTLTTVAGFACLSFVQLEQIRLLGACVALGLAWALVVAVLWIPLFVRSE